MTTTSKASQKTTKKKMILGGPGERLTHAIWHMDDLAVLANSLAAQGRCDPNFAALLVTGARETHGAATEMCHFLNYELPVRTVILGGGGK